MTNFVFNDGGRSEAGFKGETRDCVCRSIAIVTGKNYKQVYDELNELCKTEKIRKRRRRSSSRTGIYRETYDKYLTELGYKWTPTMRIGQGCKTHLRSDELPSGKIIVRVSKHLTAVIDGVINDIFDCSRDGSRCVYGYYTKI